MRYCKRCVYPMVAYLLQVDDDGICSACRVEEKFQQLPSSFWEDRKKRFERLLDETRQKNKSNYDCVIPVSGGKDSYYQTHVICAQYGLKPLLVTYQGNNYLPEGDFNRDRMRQVFNADHLVMGPSVEVLKKLNRLCFRKMGDMNWHNHCGIATYPIQVAVKFKIPLIIWGETSWDISGMHDPDDFVEFSARSRHEHDLRGYEWYDLINDPQESLKEEDLLWTKYPEDDEILEVGVRGIYIGNFFKWEPYKHTELMQKQYGWKPGARPFERTFRNMSNLDDRYENGVHDFLKFVKFGYGRASDHASKDIRAGLMTREQGVEIVRRLDHVCSSDLYYWLDYVGMTEEEFWTVANKFRDPRVWRFENGQWVKDNIWDKENQSSGIRGLKSEV